MNTNINSPEFWEQVKNEFSELNYEYFCDGSPCFKEQWHGKKSEIINFAKQFLEATNNSELIADSPLFFLRSGDDFDRRGVRLNFLDYMINRTRNEQ